MGGASARRCRDAAGDSRKRPDSYMYGVLWIGGAVLDVLLLAFRCKPVHFAGVD